MNFIHWFNQELFNIPAVKAVVVISFICAIGLALGKIRFGGIRLGVTFVFFMGILFGALGIHIDHEMLVYAEDFGLIIFVYVLGLQVGPGFFSSFKSGGSLLSLLSLGVVVIGTIMTVLPIAFGWLPIGDMMGVLCGATTNTPALAAAQQALLELGRPTSSYSAALTLAVTYPIGVVGVILSFILIKNRLMKEGDKNTESSPEEAFIASFKVSNPAIFQCSINDVATLHKKDFVVSRIWREGKVILPTAETLLEKGDRLLVITRPKKVNNLKILFGELDETDWNKADIDWNAIDSNLISRRILITKNTINGKHLGDLHLRNRFGVNVSRVQRSGIQLVATPDLILRMGDRVTVVGEAESCKKVAHELGNLVKALDEPNLITLFLGVVLGLILGYLPIAFPGMSSPVRLGLAGGPIIMGILIGAFGPRFHMVAYVTTSANLLIRSMGLAMYLACLGLDAGPQFVETVMRPAALAWLGYGTAITVIPVIIMAFIAVKLCKRCFSTASGMICGAMANPIALEYINDILPGDKAAVAYAAVYPICMFIRVVIAQLIVMFMAH